MKKILLWSFIFIVGSILFSAYFEDTSSYLDNNYEKDWHRLTKIYQGLNKTEKAEFKAKMKAMALQYTKATYFKDKKLLQTLDRKMLQLIQKIKNKTQLSYKKNMDNFLDILAQESVQDGMLNNPEMWKWRIERLQKLHTDNSNWQKQLFLARLALQKGDYKLVKDLVSMLEDKVQEKNEVKNKTLISEKNKNFTSKLNNFREN